MSEAPAFLTYQVGEDGRILNPHQTTLLRFRHSEDLVWRGGLFVPVYWATLFSKQDISTQGATVDWYVGLSNLERRQESWRAKSSSLLFRGFPRFVEWVRGVGGGRVALDVSGIDEWRGEPLMAAVKSLIAFLDDEVSAPGLLLSGDESVWWKTRKKGVQLESRSGDFSWPDEVPMFGVRSSELTAATMGDAPFRKGPWPERRLAENEFAALSPEMDTAVKERSTLVRRALEHCPNQVALTASIGNLEGVERMRMHYRKMCNDFQREALELARSAKAFADAYQVFDDTTLWNDMLEGSKQWLTKAEAAFARQEIEIQRAMKAAGASPGESARDLDLDNFPSGDDPF